MAYNQAPGHTPPLLAPHVLMTLPECTVFGRKAANWDISCRSHRPGCFACTNGGTANSAQHGSVDSCRRVWLQTHHDMHEWCVRWLRPHPSSLVRSIDVHVWTRQPHVVRTGGYDAHVSVHACSPSCSTDAAPNAHCDTITSSASVVPTSHQQLVPTLMETAPSTSIPYACGQPTLC